MLVSQAEIECQSGRELPVILNEQSKGLRPKITCGVCRATSQWVCLDLLIDGYVVEEIPKSLNGIARPRLAAQIIIVLLLAIFNACLQRIAAEGFGHGIANFIGVFGENSGAG